MALFSSSRSGGTDFNDPRSPRLGADWGPPPEPPFWQRPIGMVVMVVAIVAVLGLGAYLMAPWLAQRGIPFFGPSVLNSYSTGIAEQKQVALSNGVQITLGPVSELKVYEGEKEIALKGTAVISITPKPTDVFTVRAANTITKVLGTDSAAVEGTEFIVRAYEEGDTASSIAVVKGRVRLGEVVILNSGNVADVAKDGKTVVTFERHMGQFKGWMDGNLDFAETPLIVVAGELKRWYDVTVQMPDTTIWRDTVTATFKIDSISTALRAISQGAGVDVKRVGQKVTFSRARSRDRD
jgi:ferric-dicitrate binding protein FerR (iron transport regulator)